MGGKEDASKCHPHLPPPSREILVLVELLNFSESSQILHRIVRKQWFFSFNHHIWAVLNIKVKKRGK